MVEHRERTHAVIFTSRGAETTAVLSLLQETGEWVSKRTGTIGSLCTLEGEHGRVRIALIQVQPLGDVAAAVLQEVTQQLDPTYALLVGVGAGIRDVSPGSVVAANKVYAYDRGADGRAFQSHPDLGAGSYRLVQRAEAEARRSRWLSRLYKDAPENPPEARVAPIAAGTPIVESAEGSVWRFLQLNYTDALVVETAGRGFLQTAHQTKLDAIVVRGVTRLLSPGRESSDHVPVTDEQAARNAAAFAVEMLAHLALEDGVDGGAAERPQDPAYESPEQRELSRELREKQAERRRLIESGKDTIKVDGDILSLRRRLLNGPELTPGYTLGKGRFELIRTLGQGGFGTVWFAYDHTNGLHVALKVLHGWASRDLSMRQRFFRGAKTMDSLRHEAITAIVDRGDSEDGYHYFAMEYHPSPLREAVANQALTRQDQRNVLLGLADALSLAHKKGVCHRDVKPDNVLLDVDFKPKLTDFDLVRVPGTVAFTQTRGMGSLGYSAPELFRSGKDVSPQSDIYSLAATALFMLVGGDPPLQELMRDPFGLIAGSACPYAFKPVLARAMAWQPRDRYPTMRHFRDALEGAFAATALAIEDDKETRGTQAQMRVFSLSDEEIDVLLALAPVGLKRGLPPRSRPARRRGWLGSLDLSMDHDQQWTVFLSALRERLNSSDSSSSTSRAGQATGDPGGEDWEHLFEALVSMSEEDFEGVLERVRGSTGVVVAVLLRDSNQWKMAGALLSHPWDAAVVAAIRGEAYSVASNLGKEDTREWNPFARAALLQAKMLVAFDKLSAGARERPEGASPSLPDLDRLRAMIVERRYSEVEPVVNALTGELYSMASRAALAAVGRIHTLASEALPRPRGTVSGEAQFTWRQGRMRLYWALKSLAEEDFRRLVGRVSHPGILPSQYLPIAERAMALVRFAEHWDAVKVLSEAIGVASMIAEETPALRPGAGDSNAMSMDGLLRRLLSLPRLLLEELFFGFAVDDPQESLLDTIKFLVAHVGFERVHEQYMATRARFAAAGWKLPEEAEEQPYSDEDFRDATASAASMGTEALEWLAGSFGVPREYWISGVLSPLDEAINLFEWAAWRQDGIRELKHLASIAPQSPTFEQRMADRR